MNKEDFYMSVLSGGKVYPYCPEKSEFTIDDIITGLMNTNRFGGHTIRPYSVLAHSIWCARYAWYHLNDLTLTKQMLLHDAAEAFLGDIPSPLKWGMKEFSELENRWLVEIWTRLATEVTDIVIPNEEISKHPPIKRIDTLALYMEASTLTNSSEQWVPKNWYVEIPPTFRHPLLNYSNEQLKKEFLELLYIYRSQ